MTERTSASTAGSMMSEYLSEFLHLEHLRDGEWQYICTTHRSNWDTHVGIGHPDPIRLVDSTGLVVCEFHPMTKEKSDV